jgi:hypothetical protein
MASWHNHLHDFLAAGGLGSGFVRALAEDLG